MLVWSLAWDKLGLVSESNLRLPLMDCLLAMS